MTPMAEARSGAAAATEAGRVPISLSLVLPAFNEAASLGVVIEEAVAYLQARVAQFELIVVDDGSTDGTAEVVAAYSRRYSEVRGLRHAVNRGYGSSLRDGFAASRYEWLFFTDADHQFRLDSLEELLPLRAQADIIVGFRKHRQDPRQRLILSWGYNQLMRWLFDVRVRDIDCAFKLIRGEVLQSIHIESDRFFVNTELLVKARAAGWRIVETGVDHFPRQFDRSKVHWREIPRTLREVWSIWRRVRRGPA